jgi:signal transduction histidine kinase
MSGEARSDDWLVVMRPDGVVDAVSGGASVTWLGHRLDELSSAPPAIRDAAAHLLGRPAGAGYLRRATVDLETKRVELLLVEAMPIRRAHTRIDELVTRTLDVFATQARSAEIELALVRDETVPPTLFIDGEKISWALATLVGSALRYISQASHGRRGGRVGVHIGWHESPAELVLSVEDDGPGMSERQTRWLFERDPTTSKTAGLALVMVKDVVVAHRGSVNVESRPGHGTTLTVRLPRVHP